MSTRVTSALRVVRWVAEREHPMTALTVGSLSGRLGSSLSVASRICAELSGIGLLEHAPGYGAYRLGRRSLRVSGRAAGPTAQVVREALLRAAQDTGETVCLAAPESAGLRVVAAVVSAWTLYAPAEVGEWIPDGSCAMAQAARASRAGSVRGVQRFESVDGMSVEVAAPVRDELGDIVAVVAVRLPRNRTRSAGARARRAVAQAAAHIERAVGEPRHDLGPRDAAVTDDGPSASGGAPPVTALEAAARAMEELALGPRGVADLARAVGVSRARAHRIAHCLVAAGLAGCREDGDLRLGWSVQGWHRAAADAILVASADELVADASRRTGQCAFVTALRGMRSVTLVEKLAPQPDGLAMTPWLGRPCPIVHADAGPTLLVDFQLSEIADLIPGKPSPADVAELVDRVSQVTRSGVLAKESVEEGGQIAVSAPIRDSSGITVAAALLVGPSDAVRLQVGELMTAAVDLAAAVSRLLAA